MGSGRNGTRIFQIELVGGGGVRAAIPPQPGSPFPLFVTNTTYIPPGTSTGVAQITLYRASPPGVEPFGMSCAGTLASTPHIGIHALPNGARLHLSGGELGAFGILMLGLSRTSLGPWPLPFPLSPYGFSGCMLSTSIDATVVAGLGTAGNAAGYGFADIQVPLAATGLAVHGQWLAFGFGAAAPGGVSDALLWRH